MPVQLLVQTPPYRSESSCNAARIADAVSVRGGPFEALLARARERTIRDFVEAARSRRVVSF